MKTLRRKLARLASLKGSYRLGREVARQRIAKRGQALGFLYIDGHVRVYHGKHSIPKAHVARMRIAMPATSDYWVNDRDGEPLFVVTAEANAGMVRMLPPLLAEIRALIGERRITIVFDRGGWSPKLFRESSTRALTSSPTAKGAPDNCRNRFRDTAPSTAGRSLTSFGDQGFACSAAICGCARSRA